MVRFNNRAAKTSDLPVALEHILVFAVRYSGPLDVTSSAPKLSTYTRESTGATYQTGAQ